MEPALGGPLGDPEDSRGFRCAEALEIDQDQHCPVRRPQAPKGLGQDQPVEGGVHSQAGFPGGTSPARGLAELFQTFGIPAGFRSAVGPPQLAPRDGEQPGAGRALGAKRAGLAPSGQKALLEGVFGVSVARGEARRETQQGSLVATNEGPESLSVTPRGEGEQGAVAQRAGLGFSGHVRRPSRV